jgi:hypothetical protein
MSRRQRPQWVHREMFTMCGLVLRRAVRGSRRVLLHLGVRKGSVRGDIV